MPIIAPVSTHIKIKPGELDRIMPMPTTENSSEYENGGYLNVVEIASIQTNKSCYEQELQVGTFNNDTYYYFGDINIPKCICTIPIPDHKKVKFIDCPNYFIHECESLEEKTTISNAAITQGYTLLFNHPAEPSIVEGIKPTGGTLF
jgi:hypothetical protein